MEPRRSLEYPLPVDHPRADPGHRGVRPVVNDLAGTAHRSRLQKIDAEPLASENDMIGTDSVLVQVHQAGRGKIVLGHTRYELRHVTVIGERHGNIGFSATERGIEPVRLAE